jgi:Mn2+/Fe2+ NRAMP family transporter
MSQEAKEQRFEVEKFNIKVFIKSLGPGIVFVLTALGAGDIVDASVSGSHYGYALMWVLVLGLLVRYVVTNIMARYELCNTERLTLFQAYSVKLHKAFPYLFIGFAIFLGHVINSSMSSGLGECLTNLTGIGNKPLWALLCAASCLLIGGRNVYAKLEIVMKVLLAIMSVSFLGLAIVSKPNPLEIVHGAVGFALPKGEGVFNSLILSFSMFGTVAGSLLNFIYPQNIREKGWTGPQHKRLQRNELIFSTVMLILMDLAVWVVGAEILRPAGIEVRSIDDISKALSLVFGPAGGVIFYLGVFGALYSSLLGIATCFSSVIISNVRVIKPERTAKYGEKTQDDPIYKYMVIFFLATPLVWTLPGMPGFVVLTLAINLFNTIVLPFIFIGLLLLTISRKNMGDRFKNNWLENFILAGTTVMVIVGAVRIVIGFFS